MATFKDFFLEKARLNRWCLDGFKKVRNVSPVTIYEGTRFPQWWMVILGYTNLTRAKEVLALAIQNAGNTLAESDIKTQMLAFSATMTEQQIGNLLIWAEPKRRATGLFLPLPDKTTQELCSLLHSAAKFLRDEKPEMLMLPIRQLIGYKVIQEGISLESAIESFYEFLHGEVDLATWQGSLT